MKEIKVKVVEGTINMMSETVSMKYNEKTFTSIEMLAEYFVECDDHQYNILNYIEEAKKDIKLLQSNGYFIFNGIYATYMFIKA